MISEGGRNDSFIDFRTCSDTGNIGTIKCPVCDLLFHSLESFQNHSATPEHAFKVMLKQPQDNITFSLNDATGNSVLDATKCKVESTDIVESVLPQLNDKQPSFLYRNCPVCSKMFSGPAPYRQHLESQAHKKKVAILQNPECIGENLVLLCEPCSKSFSGQEPYTQHMNSEKHRKKLQNIQSAKMFFSEKSSFNFPKENDVKKEENDNRLWYCSICNIQCSGLVPYQQHLEGNTHFKNERRVKSENHSVKMNTDMLSMLEISNFNNIKISEKSENVPQSGNYKKSMMQVNNFSEGKISEKSEDMFQLVNGNYQLISNGVKQNDFVFPEKRCEVNVVSTDELGKLIQIISPDEKINFDELGKTKYDDDHENGFKKNEEKNPEVYHTCKLCNVSLFDKDSAAEHFESREHIKKKYGIKM